MNLMEGLSLVQRHCGRAHEYQSSIIHIKNIEYARVLHKDRSER